MVSSFNRFVKGQISLTLLVVTKGILIESSLCVHSGHGIGDIIAQSKLLSFRFQSERSFVFIVLWKAKYYRYNQHPENEITPIWNSHKNVHAVNIVVEDNKAVYKQWW